MSKEGPDANLPGCPTLPDPGRALFMFPSLLAAPRGLSRLLRELPAALLPLDPPPRLEWRVRRRPSAADRTSGGWALDAALGPTAGAAASWCCWNGDMGGADAGTCPGADSAPCCWAAGGCTGAAGSERCPEWWAAAEPSVMLPLVEAVI